MSNLASYGGPMPASHLPRYHASDIDVRAGANVAVLGITTDNGQVTISTTPEILERLALRIQIELADQLAVPAPPLPTSPPEPLVPPQLAPLPSLTDDEVAALRREIGTPMQKGSGTPRGKSIPSRATTPPNPRGNLQRPDQDSRVLQDDPILPFAALPYDDAPMIEEEEPVPYYVQERRRERVVSFEDSPAGRLSAFGSSSPPPRSR